MSTATQTTDEFSRQLAEARDRAPAGPDWLARIRDDAGARFADLGFPAAGDEDWKYTSAGSIVRRPYRGVPESGSIVDARDLARAVGASGAGRHDTVLVFADGVLVPGASRPGADRGVEVSSLAEHLTSSDEDILDATRVHLGRYLDVSAHGFTALNTAFMADGASIRVERGVAAEKVIHLVFVASGSADDPVAAHPRNLIVAEPGSSVTVVEHYLGASGAHLTNAATEVFVGDDASVSHVKVQREASDAFHVHRIQVHQSGGSRFTSHSAALGSGLSRTEIHVTLGAEQAECSLFGLYVSGGRGHVDHHTVVDHAVANTRSRELYKGILDGDARGVFTGRVLVRRDAQQIQAEQTNKNLLLDEGAVVETRPQLEIYADDVKCSHGAAIGRLDEDALFYLRQRGIDAAGARSLMTYGFGNEIVETIENEGLRSWLGDAVRQLLVAGARRALGAARGGAR